MINKINKIKSINVSDSVLIPAIMLKTVEFKSSVLFGTFTLLARSLRVLQFPTHLCKLTADGS